MLDRSHRKTRSLKINRKLSGSSLQTTVWRVFTGRKIMYYYRMLKLFCYKKRIPFLIFFVSIFISYCIGVYIESPHIYFTSALILTVSTPFVVAISNLLTYGQHDIVTNIRVKPRKLRKQTIEIIKRIENLSGNRFHFTFKEYTVCVIGLRNSCSLLEPHVEKLYFRDVLVSRDPFRIFPDGNAVTLNEFFYKTVTRDDKLELQKVLFQLI